MVHILVADDSPDILDLVEMKLQFLGHRVTRAATGTEAIAALDRHTFDLAVVDVSMPGATGLEVVDAVRRHATNRRLPVILMSAFSTSTDVERGLAMGADDYVTKPFSLRELGERVQLLLARCEAKTPTPPDDLSRSCC